MRSDGKLLLGSYIYVALLHRVTARNMAEDSKDLRLLFNLFLVRTHDPGKGDGLPSAWLTVAALTMLLSWGLMAAGELVLTTDKVRSSSED